MNSPNFDDHRPNPNEDCFNQNWRTTVEIWASETIANFIAQREE